MYTTIIEFGRNFGHLEYDRVVGTTCELVFSTDADPSENFIKLRYICIDLDDHNNLVDLIHTENIKRVKYESTNGSILVYTEAFARPYELRLSKRGRFVVKYDLEYHS